MRPLPAAMICLVWSVLIPSDANAQTLLRWKLKTGDEFVVRTEQQTESTVGFSGKSANSKIDMQMDIRWRVVKASESSFVVIQSIERLTASLSAATGSAEFDSAAKSRPVGLAKQLSDSLQPLVGAEIETEMNDRGEVLSVKPANAAAEQLFKRDNAGATDQSKSAIHQVVSQSILPLPNEEVAVSGEWKTTRELATPAGLLQQVTTYRLAELTEQEGRQLCRIESTSKFADQGNAPLTGNAGTTAIKVIDHQQSGVIVFSRDLGRVVEAQQSQKLATERPYRDTTITVTLQSTQKTTVQAASKQE
jgi:hypothetical protein